MNKIKQIKELTAELLHHCHLYYDMDAPKISDAEYDKKFDTGRKNRNGCMAGKAKVSRFGRCSS